MKKQVPKDSPGVKLFKIIDDISTAFDMFKPEMENFEKFVSNKIEEAHKIIHSEDGQTLVYTQAMKTIDCGQDKPWCSECRMSKKSSDSNLRMSMAELIITGDGGQNASRKKSSRS